MRDSRQQLSDEELSTFLRAIDHPTPALGVDRVMAVARQRRMRRSTLLAAATVVLAATVATAAVPGSFVRTLVHRTLADHSPHAIVKAARQEQSSDAAVARGIAFVPEQRTRVSFAVTQPVGSLRVRLTSDASLRITQTSADRDAQFALTSDGVLVSNEGSAASYEILIPDAIAEARIHIGGVAVYSKIGHELSCDGALDSGRSCLISMRRSRSDVSPRPSGRTTLP
jgi:hypothetical protein